MQIDRHNYEEYFILYMDNELDPAQRNQVETFVQKNPDLKEELDLLMQFKLVPDESLVFEGKEELMSPGSSDSIAGNDLSNYEEWLVLYLDNELSTSQRKALESFIAANPAVKKEWTLLQRTRLQPEEIKFADKSSLYRKEEKARILSVSWIRVAAAVLLFLLAGSAAIIVMNNRNGAGNKADEIVKSIPDQPSINPEKKVEVPKESNTAVKEMVRTDKKTDPELNSTKANSNQTAVVNVNKNPEKLVTPVKDATAIVKEEPVVVNKPSNNLPQPLNKLNEKTYKTTTDLANDNTSKEILTSRDPLTSNVVTAASYNPSNTIDEEPSGDKKNKLRGLLRKVTRTFEKRTGSDPGEEDDRLLVAGLSLKIK